MNDDRKDDDKDALAWLVQCSQLMRDLAESPLEEGEHAGNGSLAERVARFWPESSVCAEGESDWRLVAKVIHDWGVDPVPFWFYDLVAEQRGDPLVAAELLRRAQEHAGAALEGFWRGLLALQQPDEPGDDVGAAAKRPDAGFWRCVRAYGAGREPRLLAYWAEHLRARERPEAVKWPTEPLLLPPSNEDSQVSGGLPAVTTTSTQNWYQHRRDNGDLPAWIQTNGTQEWYQHGLMHRRARWFAFDRESFDAGVAGPRSLEALRAVLREAGAPRLEESVLFALFESLVDAGWAEGWTEVCRARGGGPLKRDPRAMRAAFAFLSATA